MAINNFIITTCKYALTFFLILSTSATYSQIYKKVDKHGGVTFSDKASPTSEIIEVREPNTTETVEVSIKPNDNKPKTTKAKPLYKRLSIIEPTDGTIIPNGLVPLTISSSVQPSLQEEHTLQLLLDGKVYSKSKTGRFTLSSVSRGSHKLQLNIIDNNNKIIKQSAATTIHAYRPGQ